MIANELSRMVKRWLLNHEKYGIEPMLANIRVVEGDDRPDLTTVYSDAEDECVSKGINPDVTPCIVVLADGGTVGTNTRSGLHFVTNDSPLAILYCEGDVPIAKARVRGGYVLTALIESLWALSQPRIAQSYRHFGEVELIEFKKITAVRASGRLGQANLIGAVLAETFAHRVVRT